MNNKDIESFKVEVLNLVKEVMVQMNNKNYASASFLLGSLASTISLLGEMNE